MLLSMFHSKLYMAVALRRYSLPECLLILSPEGSSSRGVVDGSKAPRSCSWRMSCPSFLMYHVVTGKVALCFGACKQP